MAVLKSGFQWAAVCAALLFAANVASAQDKPASESWTAQLVGRIRDATQNNPTNESGIAKVRFTLDRSGQVVQSSVAESSGSTALDLEAIAIVTRAAPFPSPSEADAKGRDLTFVVPIRFTARPAADTQAALALPDWTPAPSAAPQAWPDDAPPRWPPDAPVQPFMATQE